jgi:hypothetical protein
VNHLPYREVWAADFEFAAPPGHRPRPLCLVARELRSGRLVRRWLDGDAPARPPYPTDAGALFVAYYASAELGCHLALGWPLPERVLDLYAEFRTATNGRPPACGSGLLGALAHFGLPALDAAEKESLRELAQRGGPYTDGEKLALLDYCQSDVDSLARLLPAMLPGLDLPRALLRGRYTAAAARMEWEGVPLDAGALGRLLAHWQGVRGRLVEAVDAGYGVFVPAGRRDLDPGSRYGAAVLAAARDWGLDPHDLDEAARFVWSEERRRWREREEALRAARKATGLNARRAGLWEKAGSDSGTWPGLDGAARELAGTYPELGIGRGYDPDAPDADDHAGRLWDLLREPAARPRPRHDPEVLRRAAELVGPGAPARRGGRGPYRFSAERWGQYLARKGIPCSAGPCTSAPA